MDYSKHFFHLGRPGGILKHRVPVGWHLPGNTPANTLTLFDPELLYIECKACNRPVLWERGKTTALLEAAHIDPHDLDASCMVFSDGCPLCRPQEELGFVLTVVRVAGLSADDHLRLVKPNGTA